jgi:hypothetical protein
MAIWEELGIVPTVDPKAIRRAYADRLRGLDPDQDPAAFQRLRQAFEAALSRAEQPARTAPRTTRELALLTTEGDAKPTPAPRVVVPSHRSTGEAEVSPPIEDNHIRIAVDDAQWRAVFKACRSALATGDVEAACSRLMEGWAQGLIPIAEQDDIVAEVMAAAVDDRTMPPERFQFMTRHLGWDRLVTLRTGTNVALRKRILLRLDAEAWHATLVANATKKDRWPTPVDQQERWLARVLLGMAPRWRLALVHSEVIRWQLQPYDAFEPWLQGRIDARRVTLAKETLRSTVHSSWATLFWPWHIIISGLAIFGLMLVTRLGRGAIPRENPSPLAWSRRVKQQAKLRGVPLGLAALRRALALTVWIFFFVCVLVLGVACLIAVPHLSLVIVIAGFVMRLARKKPAGPPPPPPSRVATPPPGGNAANLPPPPPPPP